MSTQPSEVFKTAYTQPYSQVSEIEVDIDAQTLNHPKWELLQKLQTTLDVSELIGIFANCVNGYLSYDGISYHHALHGLNLSTGQRTRHHVNYTLTLDEVSYGELTFYQNEAFKEDDLTLLEDFLCVLIYPLKNALKHYEALQSAYFDKLTGIPNRSGFEPSLNSEWGLAKRHHQNLSLLTIDIDRFKDANDNYGHACGDHVLMSVARIISENIRESDLLYRYGGDEFVTILRNTCQDGAMILAERIRHAISSCLIQYKDAPIQVSVSVGVASAKDCHNCQQLRDNADAAMYRAKKDGRDLVSL